MKTILAVLCVLGFGWLSLSQGQDAAAISALVPPEVGRFQLVAATGTGGEAEIFKIDSVTGQVWWINKRSFKAADGTEITVTGWELVPTMNESMERMAEQEKTRTSGNP